MKEQSWSGVSGTGLAIGAAIGMMFGLMLNNLVWGLIMGALIGLVSGSIFEFGSRKVSSCIEDEGVNEQC
ncbi:hypothetical protein DRO31_04815 [Candidatus Bathyarchaeota archaeon]|nr:MAG: hypothetical protein DRO31_04815 [Candidatus Bathyarchaeota archaeon]